MKVFYLLDPVLTSKAMILIFNLPDASRIYLSPPMSLTMSPHNSNKSVTFY